MPYYLLQLMDAAKPAHKATVSIYYPKYVSGALWELKTPGAFARVPTATNLPVIEVNSSEDNGRNRTLCYMVMDSGIIVNVFTLYRFDYWGIITSVGVPGEGWIHQN